MMTKQVNVRFLLFSLVLFGAAAHAQSLKPRVWVTNGEVRAVVKNGRTTYIGGNFTYVGPGTGSGVVLNQTTGTVLPSSPRVHGDVLAALPDGNNGWYIGGNFTSVNGVQRQNIAHVLPNGTLDLTWNPQPDGPVYALDFGSGGLYVGGRFSTIGGATRSNAALVNLTTGAALEWNPLPNNAVRAIHVSPPYVYLGGEFTVIGSPQQFRNYLARTDLDLGMVDGVWNPNPNDHVFTIVTAVGQNNVWFGGAFSNVDTASRPFLASATIGGQGTATNWNPRPNLDVRVIKLVGGRLYAGGLFTSFADSARGRLASVDPFAARVFSWNPNADGPVNSLVYFGNTFFIGGSFTSVGQAPRNNLAAVDSLDGAPLAWNPNPAAEVNVVAAQGNVFAGGLFRSVNGVERHNLAALDDSSGSTAWNPGVNNTVHALALSGTTLYIGGIFDGIGGQPIGRLGAVSTSTGLPTAWRPQVGNGIVQTIETAGGVVYAGGAFATVGTAQRANLAAIDSATAQATGWDPSPNDSVAALRISGNAIYVAGNFTLIGAQSRNRIAAVDRATGSLTSWIPASGGVTKISAIAVNGTTVFVGGNFSLIGGQARNSLAALDAATGAVASFTPQLNPQSSVRALALAGNSLYVGGTLNGTSDVISLNRNSGATNAWNPQVRNDAYAVLPFPVDTGVYVGGRFAGVLNESRPSFAGVTDPALLQPAFTSNTTLIHFGLVPLLQSKDDSVLVRNTGGGPLVISSATTTNPAFVVVPAIPPSVQLLPGESRAFVIRFTPTAGGGQTGVIAFGHNGPGSPSSITLTGVGSGPTFHVSRPSLQFGDVRVGTSKQDTITIGNPGNATLEVTQASSTTVEFAVTPVSATIPAGGSSVFTVAFTPGTRGNFGDELSFTHNAFGSPSIVDVSGNGVVSEVLALPRVVLFDSVAVGSTKTLMLGLVNSGNADLHIDSVRVRGVDAAEFSIIGSTGPFAPVVPLFDTLKIPVRFAPRSLSGKSAQLIVSSDAFASPDTILLNGSGRNSLIQITLTGDTSIGRPLQLSAQGPPGFPISSARIFYRKAGRTRYDSLNLSVTGQTYVGTFPDTVVTPRGVEYYIRLDGPQGSITNPEDDPTTSPATVRVRVPSLPSTLQLAPERYRMISVPLDLLDARPSVQLEDDFGPYNAARWRLFRWENNHNAEHENINAAFLPGNAFWLITQSGGNYDAEQGRSVLSGRQYDIPLQPGWNQIACPFAFAVDWGNIINSELLVAPYYWDGVEYIPNVSVLDPWEGYFVLNDSSGPITISVPPFETEEGLRKYSLPQLLAGEYRLQLSAYAGEWRDTHNYVGFLESARDDIDRSDLPEPPMIGQHLALSIVEGGRKFIGNFKPPTQEGAVWKMQLSATLPGRNVRIVLHASGALPESFEIHILDEDDFSPVPLEGGAFEVRSGEGVRTFSLIIGTRAFAERVGGGIPLIPVDFVLEQNYPNPFNPATTIRYSLGKRSIVTLEIFDVLGRKVTTLVQAEQLTGTHTVIWDGTMASGTQAASGVYLYRLQAGDLRASKKLLLMR